MQRDQLRSTATAAADIAELADKLAAADVREIHPTVRAYARMFAGASRIVSRGVGALADVAQEPISVHQDGRYVAAAFGDDLVELAGLSPGDDLDDGSGDPIRFAEDLEDAIHNESGPKPPPMAAGQALCVKCGTAVTDDDQKCPKCGGTTFLESAQ